MARATHKIAGGGAIRNVVDHPYYLKPIPMNPYIGAVHDGVSTDYNQGYSSKPMPFLYRFRYNLLPPGMQTGFFCRNPGGKYVHWLEVSTIEKMRVRIVSEEGWVPSLLGIGTILFTIYHVFRLLFYHPDLSLYPLAIWTSKPWVQQTRFSKKHPLDKPIFRYITRVPEVYGTDPMRDLYALKLAANDPWLNFVKSIGREKDLSATPQTRQVGTGSFGRLLPRDDIPHEDKHGHNLGFMR